jgi:hypothetical protein
MGLRVSPTITLFVGRFLQMVLCALLAFLSFGDNGDAAALFLVSSILCLACLITVGLSRGRVTAFRRDLVRLFTLIPVPLMFFGILLLGDTPWWGYALLVMPPFLLAVVALLSGPSTGAPVSSEAQVGNGT